MTLPRPIHDTIRLERRFEATPARVFRAWADPAARDRWFVQGEGWEIAEYRQDFRVGGRESGRFRFGKDGPVITNETIYHDIEPDRRIVFAYTMGMPNGPLSSSLATVELQGDGDATVLRFTEQITVLDGSDSVANRAEGWTELLDRLAVEIGEGNAA